MFNNEVSQGTSLPFSLSAQFVFSTAGVYRVGLCGTVTSSDPAAWNNNDVGRTAAFVTQA